MRGGWRERFFELLENDERETKCAELAGVSREYVSRLKKADPAFASEIENRIAKCRSTKRNVALRTQRRELSLG